MKRRLSIRTMTVTFPLALFAAIVVGNVIWIVLDGLFFQTQKACASRDRIEKAVTSSILRAQMQHHYETGSFASHIDQLDKYLSDDYLALDVSVKNYGHYATVNVSPDSTSTYILSYAGAVSYNQNASEESWWENYESFKCYTVSPDALPELHPVSDSGGELKFECPEGTGEDC